MDSKTKIYIAGIGMTTPVGANAEMTAAAVNAGISAYSLSHYDDQQGSPVTMAGIPEQLFNAMQVDINAGTYYREQYDHIIKMAVHALQDTFSSPQLNQQPIKQPVPLILAMPEPQLQLKPINTEFLINTMVKLSGMPVDLTQVRSIHTGRAAGIDGLDMAYRYLDDLKHDYVLIGGSDSYWDVSLINQLDNAQRLLTTNNNDGFAPGEAAGFLLLTRHAKNALQHNSHIVELHPPGITEEEGHLNSEKPYRGNGLDQAFKQALNQHKNKSISTIYSSMNGENFWAKEHGVAMIRNKNNFHENLTIEHPADCYGDLGAATGSVLIGLSAIRLLQQKQPGTHLVYSASDGATRAAICVEKIALHQV